MGIYDLINSENFDIFVKCETALDNYINDHGYDDKALVHFIFNKIGETSNKPAFLCKVISVEKYSIISLNSHLKKYYAQNGLDNYINYCHNSFLICNKYTNDAWLILFEELIAIDHAVIKELRYDFTDINRLITYCNSYTADLDQLNRVMKEDVFKKYSDILRDEYIKWLEEEKV